MRGNAFAFAVFDLRDEGVRGQTARVGEEGATFERTGPADAQILARHATRALYVRPAIADSVDGTSEVEKVEVDGVGISTQLRIDGNPQPARMKLVGGGRSLHLLKQQ